MGAEHIASGYDHLLFVALLVLAGGALRRTALSVTGFTLGHSVTLALAVTGVAAPHEGPVEAMIGLSIAVLAVESAWLLRRDDRVLPAATVLGILAVAGVVAWSGRPGAMAYAGMALFTACSFVWLRRAQNVESLRVAAASLFGLLHGLGFARALGELHLPRERLAKALLGFNVGVELGQMAFVLAVFPVVVLLRGRPSRQRVVRWLCAGALGCGACWYVHRALS